MREKINQYLDLQKELGTHFGIGDNPIEYYLDFHWMINDGELTYGEEYRPGDDYELDFSLEYTKLIKEVDGLSCFYVCENGQKFYAIFDNNKRIDN